MEIYEAMVASFLTAHGEAFICPQYDVAWNPNLKTGGSAPDFVVIDFARRDVAVVEVSAAWNLDALIDRIKNRQDRWYKPIRNNLIRSKVIDESWPQMRAIIFIREEWTKMGGDGWAEKQIPDNDVTFVGLESVAFGYAWHERRKRGLPRFFQD